MPVLLIPNVRTSQPSEPTGIDLSNAVTSGVKLAMRSLADPAMSFGAGTVAHNANSVLRGTAKGLARKYTFSGFAANYSTFSNSPNTAKSCYMLQGIRGADSSSNYFAVIPSAKVGIATDGRIYFNYAATNNFTTKTIAVGAPFTVFFWGQDHDIVSLDLDGEVITYTDASGWGGVNFIDIIGGDAPNGSSNHTILSVVGWNRYLSAAERVSLRNNPWQVFEPEVIPLFWSSNPPQIVYPNGDVAGGAWLPSTGTDLFACVDESAASDADYIYTTVPGAYQEFYFPNCGAVDPSTGGHVRYRIPAGTGTITAILKQGSTTLQTLGTHTLTGSAQDIDITISASVADSDDLRVGFTASA